LNTYKPDNVENDFFGQWTTWAEQKEKDLEDAHDDINRDFERDKTDYVTKSLPANVNVEKLVDICICRQEDLADCVSNSNIYQADLGLELVNHFIKAGLISLKRVKEIGIKIRKDTLKWRLEQEESAF